MSKRKKSFNKNKQARQAQSGTSVPLKLNLRVLAGVAIIALAAFLAYLPSINGGFVLDDDLLLAKNELIKASDGLCKLWCTTESLEYYPVSYSTHWIEWRLWGKNPTGYHVTNLILHVVEALLIWVILRKLSFTGAFLAAMIFAVHPVNVESVAWIAQRRNVAAMLFFLLSILWYLKLEIPSLSLQNGLYRIATLHAPRFSLLCYWLSLAAFMLAMLSKGSAAVLPVLLLGIVWWLRSLTRRDLVRIAPFFLLAVVLTGVNIWFQTHGTDIKIRNADFTERLLGAGGVVWFYLYRALLPIDLAFIYPQWHIEAGNPLWWLPLLAVLAITTVLWRYGKGWSRPLLFAWGFFCVSLVPVMGFTDVGFMKYSLVADHYQHIAIIGVIALLSAGFSAWHQGMRGAIARTATVLAIVAVGTLTFMTWRQSGIYRDAMTLYQDTLNKNPECWMAHYGLGLGLFKTGRPQEEIKQYEQALRLKPDYAEAHNNLGAALADIGQPEEAIEHYEQALRLKPDYPEAHYNLGYALANAGRLQEAIEHYEQALRLKPDYANAHNNLGNALKSTGHYQEAIEHLRQALRLSPDSIEAHNNLGATLAQSGRYEEAIEYFEQALRLKPDFTNVYYNLALVYASTQQSSEAIGAAQKGLELARSQGQGVQAKQIEDWLNAYRLNLSNSPNVSPPSKSNRPAH
jgi:tetratricopeptide (TPR) repeat protein